MVIKNIFFLVFVFFSVLFAKIAGAVSINLQSTTSTKNSGFYDYVLPIFTKNTGIKVYVVAVGTGQAIKNAQNCDSDVLLVHAKDDEERFVSQGYGVKRFNLMYNDFVIIGPASDPAKISGTKTISVALKNISKTKSLFTSRGDNSGTHKREKLLWRSAGIHAANASGSWYREIGAGMGTTLNTSIGMGSYTLTDRATWVTFKNKYDFKIYIEGKRALFNQYGVILVNPERCPNVKAQAGQKFIDWLMSAKGQNVIGSFRKFDQQLFFPNAESETGP
jgi:tungstate transport system substrate-binding protein